MNDMLSWPWPPSTPSHALTTTETLLIYFTPFISTGRKYNKRWAIWQPQEVSSEGTNRKWPSCPQCLKVAHTSVLLCGLLGSINEYFSALSDMYFKMFQSERSSSRLIEDKHIPVTSDTYKTIFPHTLNDIPTLFAFETARLQKRTSDSRKTKIFVANRIQKSSQQGIRWPACCSVLCLLCNSRWKQHRPALSLGFYRRAFAVIVWAGI